MTHKNRRRKFKAKGMNNTTDRPTRKNNRAGTNLYARALGTGHRRIIDEMKGSTFHG